MLSQGRAHTIKYGARLVFRVYIPSGFIFDGGCKPLCCPFACYLCISVTDKMVYLVQIMPLMKLVTYNLLLPQAY